MRSEVTRCPTCLRFTWRGPQLEPDQDRWEELRDQYLSEGRIDEARDCDWHAGELDWMRECGRCTHGDG